MKFFSFFMAFLVLALSILPCADYEDCNTECEIKNTLTKAARENKETQQDDCSPFCTCTCCAGFSINHFIASLINISAYNNTLLNSFLPTEVIEIALPIWQPPRLV